MPIQRLPLVLRHNAIQRIAHVGAHIFVVVLVQAQRARRVLDEQVQEARFVLLELRQRVCDVRGDEVRAARARGQGEGFLEPVWGGLGRWAWAWEWGTTTYHDIPVAAPQTLGLVHTTLFRGWTAGTK